MLKLTWHDLVATRKPIADLIAAHGGVEIYEGDKKVATIVAPDRYDRLALCEAMVEVELGGEASRPSEHRDFLTYAQVLENV